VKLRRIVIVGFMGAGKTTVARALASKMQLESLDLDEIISEQQKTTIPDLIKDKGEATFRDSETFMLGVVLERKVAQIIGLGGGAWMSERNRELINKHDCLTIFLDAPFELCWKRITEQDEVRPLALDRGSAHKLYRERQPVYELAELHVKVGEEASADDLAAEIVSSLRRRRHIKDPG
jgi:shikimate kinase